MGATCKNCRAEVEEWNRACGGCGYTLVLQPEEETRARYLRVPALGALLWTQGWTLGSRLYFWFIVSLFPLFSPFALVACLIFGRRWSWKHGSWASWDEFKRRMRLLDIIAACWVAVLALVYLSFRYVR